MFLQKYIWMRYIKPVVSIKCGFFKYSEDIMLHHRSQYLQFCINIQNFDLSALHTTIHHGQLKHQLYHLIKQNFSIVTGIDDKNFWCSVIIIFILWKKNDRFYQKRQWRWYYKNAGRFERHYICWDLMIYISRDSQFSSEY